MLKYLLISMATCLFVACGVSDADKAKKSEPIPEQVMKSPKKIVARVAIKDLEQQDFSRVQFAPVNSQDADVVKAFDKKNLNQNYQGDFQYLGKAERPQNALGLCGGYNGGGYNGGGCGGCGGGCGGFGPLSWVGGLLGGIGDIIGGIIYGVGSLIGGVTGIVNNVGNGIGGIMPNYQPWYGNDGYYSGYSYNGNFDDQDYRYYEYGQNGYYPPNQMNTTGDSFFYPIPGNQNIGMNQNQINGYPNQGYNNQNQVNGYPNQGYNNQNQVNTYPNQWSSNQNQINNYPNQGNTIQNQVNSYPNQGNTIQNQVNSNQGQSIQQQNNGSSPFGYQPGVVF
jgi:hypothetical protein